MEQTPLFHEDLRAALGYVISALGGNKRVGSSMWPSMSPDKAGRKVADCLSDSHAQRFTEEDIMWILRAGRQAGVHSAMAFLTTECGYEPPRPLEPEDERAKLQRDYIAATQLMREIANRMDRLATSDDDKSGKFPRGVA